MTCIQPCGQSANGTPHLDLFHTALQRNKTWSHRVNTENPELFRSLATSQHPEILWIGCSDSRVPETTVLGLNPGDVFVHRNIANVVHPGDLSAAAVVTYGVAHLKVKHVVLCGHSNCGGAAAAMGNATLGVLDPWLLPLRTLRRQHLKAFDGLSPADSARKLVELNVRQGVQTLKENGSVIAAMRDRGLVVHGLVYEVATGELTELDVTEGTEDARGRTAAFSVM